MSIAKPTRPPRTIRGVVRERLLEIERQMELGYRHQTILEGLAAEGYAMNLEVFRNALYHARRRRRRLQSASLATPVGP